MLYESSHVLKIILKRNLLLCGEGILEVFFLCRTTVKQRAKCCYSQQIAGSDVISLLGHKGKLSKSLRDTFYHSKSSACAFFCHANQYFCFALPSKISEEERGWRSGVKHSLKTRYVVQIKIYLVI